MADKNLKQHLYKNHTTIIIHCGGHIVIQHSQETQDEHTVSVHNRFYYKKEKQWQQELQNHIFAHTKSSQAWTWASRKSLRSNSDVSPVRSGSRSIPCCSLCSECLSFVSCVTSVFLFRSSFTFFLNCFCSEVTIYKRQ